MVTRQPLSLADADSAAALVLERRAHVAALQLRQADRQVMRQIQCGLCIGVVVVVSGAFYIYLGLI